MSMFSALVHEGGEGRHWLLFTLASNLSAQVSGGTLGLQLLAF